MNSVAMSLIVNSDIYFPIKTSTFNCKKKLKVLSKLYIDFFLSNIFLTCFCIAIWLQWFFVNTLPRTAYEKVVDQIWLKLSMWNDRIKLKNIPTRQLEYMKTNFLEIIIMHVCTRKSLQYLCVKTPQFSCIKNLSTELDYQNRLLKCFVRVVFSETTLFWFNSLIK